MRRYVFLVILISSILVFSFSVAMAGERTIIRKYDNQGNRTGYSVIEDGRESHFDEKWNRTGTSIHQKDGGRVDHFDRSWRRDGRSDVEKEKENNNPLD